MSDRHIYASGAPVFITPQLKNLARALLMNPEELHWCRGICDVIGLGSGSVSPMLKKLTSIDWLEVVEDEHHHHPPRVYYRLTEEGEIMLSAIVWSD